MAMDTATEQVYDKEIDARGSFCPGPLLELIRGLKCIPIGGVVAVLTSDPESEKDIPLWVKKVGHRLVEARAEQDATRFIVCKLH